MMKPKLAELLGIENPYGDPMPRPDIYPYEEPTGLRQSSGMYNLGKAIGYNRALDDVWEKMEKQYVSAGKEPDVDVHPKGGIGGLVYVRNGTGWLAWIPEKAPEKIAFSFRHPKEELRIQYQACDGMWRDICTNLSDEGRRQLWAIEGE